MKVSDVYGGQYLKAAMIGEDRFRMEIKKVVEELVGQEEDRKIVLYFTATEKGLVLNATNANTLAAAYGDDMAGWIEYGASPRATICLDRCARAHAWLAGRDYVGPEDIQAVAYDVLRHRLILCFEAEAEGITPDQIIGELIARIAVP